MKGTTRVVNGSTRRNNEADKGTDKEIRSDRKMIGRMQDKRNIGQRGKLGY